MTSVPDNLQKWALVVGVDRYEHLDPRYHLEGCVNDARAMAGLLRAQFQFPEENITLLLDEQATQRAILDAMRGLERKVGKDDIVVFHYSGHGSQRTDGPEKDEEDGLDETILAYDARRGGPESDEPNFDLSDDDIHAWLQDITKQTRHVTLIFDCCHSGTVARTGPDAIGPLVRVRWVPPDGRPYEKLRPDLYAPPFAAPVAARGAVEGFRRSGPSGWLPDDEKYVLLAGCRSKERSFEVRLHEGEVRAHGVFTFHLLRALSGAAADVSYRDVFERVASRVTADFPVQHPQLEGARERQLFGPLHLEPMRFVAVRERNGGSVTLEAGAALGMSRGGLWEVYPPGTRDTGQTAPLGRVEIQLPRAVTSEALVIEETENGTIGPGCRAVAVTPDFGQKLSVAVEGFAAAAEWVGMAEKAVGRSPLLRLVKGSIPQVRVELTPPTRISANYPAQGAIWRSRSVDSDDLVMQDIPASDQDAISRLVRNLETKARYNNVLRLENPGSLLAGKVDLLLFRKQGGGWVEIPEGKETVLNDGEQVMLEIRNRHHRPLFVQILDLGMRQGITLLHPKLGGCEELPQDGWFRIGERDGDEIYLGIPKELPYHRNGDPGVRGVEILKMFVTDQPVDLAPLLQLGFRAWGGTSGSLVALFGSLMGTIEMPREILCNLPEEQWTVVERALVVERCADGARPAAEPCNPSRPSNVFKSAMDHVHPAFSSQAHLEVKVERLERRLGSLIAAFEALVRQLEISQGMEPSPGVLLSLTKTKLDA